MEAKNQEDAVEPHAWLRRALCTASFCTHCRDCGNASFAPTRSQPSQCFGKDLWHACRDEMPGWHLRRAVLSAQLGLDMCVVQLADEGVGPRLTGVRFYVHVVLPVALPPFSITADTQVLSHIFGRNWVSLSTHI